MDDELESVELHQKLDYVVQWHGITFDHVAYILAFTGITTLCTFFVPILRMLPTWPFLAAGVAALVFIVTVQFRKDPEHFSAALEHWRAPQQLSPFLATQTTPEFPFDNFDLWEKP
jgi:hypothetical protein